LDDRVCPCSASGLEPVINQVFVFKDARQIFSHLQSGGRIGKIVIKVGG